MEKLEYKLKLLKDYMSIRIDIQINDNKYLSFPFIHNLPTFDYYLKNCVNDKGGKYDFTVRRYKTKTINVDVGNISFEQRFYNKTKSKRVEYSIWMGTPFNFKEIYKY